LVRIEIRIWVRFPFQSGFGLDSHSNQDLGPVPVQTRIGVWFPLKLGFGVGSFSNQGLGLVLTRIEICVRLSFKFGFGFRFSSKLGFGLGSHSDLDLRSVPIQVRKPGSVPIQIMLWVLFPFG
jgi:hypothetical protein